MKQFCRCDVIRCESSLYFDNMFLLTIARIHNYRTKGILIQYYCRIFILEVSLNFQMQLNISK